MDLNNENIWKIYAPLFEEFTPSISKKLLSDAAGYCVGKVIDLGCGSGKLWKYLDKEKVESVFAVEKNPLMVDLAFKKIIGEKMGINIELLSKDLTNFSSKIKYDSAVSLNVLYTQPSLNTHLNLAYELLNFGGKFIISSPNTSANMGELEKLVDKEFSGENYNLFKKCNHFLSKGFNPNLYSIEEVKFNLEQIGFKIEIANNDYYNNQNFFIVAKK